MFRKKGETRWENAASQKHNMVNREGQKTK